MRVIDLIMALSGEGSGKQEWKVELQIAANEMVWDVPLEHIYPNEEGKTMLLTNFVIPPKAPVPTATGQLELFNA